VNDFTDNDIIVEEALLLKIDLSDFDWTKARSAIDRMASRIVVALEGIGEFDGEDFGEGICTLYTYGPDAEQLLRAVHPLLEHFELAPRSLIVLRYGLPGSPERLVASGWK